MLWFVSFTGERKIVCRTMSVTWMHSFVADSAAGVEGCKGWTYLSPRASLVSNFKLIPLIFENLFLFLLICISESKCPSVFCCKVTHSLNKNRIFYIVFGLRNCMFFLTSLKQAYVVASRNKECNRKSYKKVKEKIYIISSPITLFLHKILKFTRTVEY